MQICKIRDRSGSISIKYELEGATATLTTGAIPPQTFVDAFDALKTVVRSILDVSDQWMGRVKITGLTLTKVGDDNARVVIIAKRDLVEGGTPFNIATPARFLRPGAEENGGNALALTPGDAALVQELCAQAEEYVKNNPAMRQFYLPGFEATAIATSSSGAVHVEVVADDQHADDKVIQMPDAQQEKPKRSRKKGTDNEPHDPEAAAGGE